MTCPHWHVDRETWHKPRGYVLGDKTRRINTGSKDIVGRRRRQEGQVVGGQGLGRQLGVAKNSMVVT